MFSTSALSDYN